MPDVIGNKATERISRRVLLPLIIAAVVVFVAFWTIGFNISLGDGSTYSTPLLTDVLLAFIYIVCCLAVVTMFVGMVSGWRKRSRDRGIVNGIPSRLIGWSVAVGLLFILVLTFIFGSSEPIRSNGRLFDSWFWLRTSDMFVNSSLLLMLVAVLLIGWGKVKRFRKK